MERYKPEVGWADGQYEGCVWDTVEELHHRGADGFYWTAYLDTPEAALDAAKRKCAELNAPKVPHVTDWFEECSPEEAVFMAGNMFAALYLVGNDGPHGAVDCTWTPSREGTIAALGRGGRRPVRPKAVRP